LNLNVNESINSENRKEIRVLSAELDNLKQHSLNFESQKEYFEDQLEKERRFYSDITKENDILIL